MHRGLGHWNWEKGCGVMYIGGAVFEEVATCHWRGVTWRLFYYVWSVFFLLTAALRPRRGKEDWPVQFHVSGGSYHRQFELIWLSNEAEAIVYLQLARTSSVSNRFEANRRRATLSFYLPYSAH